jgi:hypothetical protein
VKRNPGSTSLSAPDLALLNPGYSLAIRRRCPALDVEDADRNCLEIDAKDDSVVSDAPAECNLAGELRHVARKRIGAHAVERRQDALLVSGGNALEISSAAVADRDGPAHGGVDSSR